MNAAFVSPLPVGNVGTQHSNVVPIWRASELGIINYA
jgi:hypothetical protein